MESAALVPRPLLVAALAACLSALIAREAHVAGAALAILAAWAARRFFASGTAVLWAIPAALAAVPGPQRSGPADLGEGPVRFCGIVVKKGYAAHGGTWLALCDRSDGRLAISCMLPGSTEAEPGDIVSGVGRAIGTPEDPRDMPRVEVHPRALSVTHSTPNPRRLVAGLRACLSRALGTGLAPANFALMSQLVLGSGPQVGEDVRAAHRATGLSHLLAVSGAHVTLVAGILLLLQVRVLRVADGGRSFARARMLAIASYALVTGLEAPVVRAAVAFLLVGAVHDRGRRTSLASLLAAPALLTALVWPEDLFSVSFQLSYAAVLGLGCAGAPRNRSRGELWFWMPLRASVWAVVTTAPLTLWYFGTLAPWTIVATPLLAPVVGFMLAIGLFAAVLGALLPGAAGLLAAPLDALSEFYIACVHAFTWLPGAPVFALALPSPSIMIACGLLGCAAFVWLRGRRGVAALAALLAIPHAFPAPAPKVASLELLAVGHGQACLVRERDGTTVLIDCGCLGTPERAAELARRALLPSRRLDWLVLTHADADHAGGALRLVQGVAVTHVVLPDDLAQAPLGKALAAAGAKLVGIAPGEQVVPCAHFAVDRPQVPRGDRNESSLWIRARLDAAEVVVPGDAMEVGTRAWLQSPCSLPAAALVLPHHGRKNAATAELLQRVRPRAVLVSNRTGEPLPDAASTASALGLPVYSTGSLGTIKLEGGAPLQLTSARPLRF